MLSAVSIILANRPASYDSRGRLLFSSYVFTRTKFHGLLATDAPPAHVLHLFDCFSYGLTIITKIGYVVRVLTARGVSSPSLFVVAKFTTLGVSYRELIGGPPVTPTSVPENGKVFFGAWFVRYGELGLFKLMRCTFRAAYARNVLGLFSVARGPSAIGRNRLSAHHRRERFGGVFCRESAVRWTCLPFALHRAAPFFIALVIRLD